MNELSRLKNSFFALLGGTFFSSVLGFFSIGLIAKGLGLEQFGIFALCLSIVAVIDKVVNFQSWQALIKFGTDYLNNKKYNEFLRLVKFCILIDSITALLGLLIALIISPLIVMYFSWGDDSQTVLNIIIISLIFKFSSFSLGVFRLFDRNKEQALVQVYSSVIKLSLIGGCYLLDANVVYYALAWTISELVLNLCLSIQAILILKSKNKKWFFPFDITMDKKVFKFVFWTNLTSLVDLPAKELDVVLLSVLTNETQAGLYRLAKQAMTIIGRLIGPLYQSIYPIQTDFIEKKKIADVMSFTKNITLKIGAFSILPILFSYFLMEYFVLNTLGREYIELIPIAIFAIFIKCIDVIFTLYHSLFIAFGYVKKNVQIVLVANIIMMLLFLIIVPIYGTYAAIACLFIQSMITFAWKYRYMNERI